MCTRVIALYLIHLQYSRQSPLRFNRKVKISRKKQADRLRLHESKYCFISASSFYLLAPFAAAARKMYFSRSRCKNKREIIRRSRNCKEFSQNSRYSRYSCERVVGIVESLATTNSQGQCETVRRWNWGESERSNIRPADRYGCPARLVEVNFEGSNARAPPRGEREPARD